MEQPVPQYLKVINFLDCFPGRADKAGTEEPIAIVTFEHNGEVEQPCMLRLRDANKLAVHLIAVLAHHGNEMAQELMEKYFRRESGKGDAEHAGD